MKWLLAALIVILILIVGIVIHDVTHFHVTENVFVSEKLKREHTFVFLTDLHDRSFGRDNADLLAAIDRIAPDCVLIGGDLMTAHRGADHSASVSLARKLAERYPVYYASGNHEYRAAIYPEVYGSMSRDYEAAIAHPNLTRMHNDKVLLDNEVLLCALEIEREYYSRFHPRKMEDSYPETLLGPADETFFTLMLAHNPEYYPVYSAYGADLVLSGHVHGGIARIPGLGGVIDPRLRLFPKFDGGVFLKSGATIRKLRGKSSKERLFVTADSVYMLIGRGLGTHTLPIRFLNPGQLNVIRLCPN